MADHTEPLHLEWHGHVATITFDAGENRLNPTSVGQMHLHLDEIENYPGPKAVVVCGGEKFFSNGLDLERFAEFPDELPTTISSLHQLFGRLLVFPAYVVAAITGHAFAGGAMLASVFDHRVMNEERGYWCLNEVDLQMSLTPEMYAAVAARVPKDTLATAMLTGRRFTGPQALSGGIADEIAPASEVLERAISQAELMATKSLTSIESHKRLLHGEAAAKCHWTGVYTARPIFHS